MAKSYPETPLVSAHALVCDGDRVLLAQRGRPPHVGHWSLPGGGVELGETIAEAAVREVQEETGLHVAITRYLGFADAIDRDAAGRIEYHYVIHYFAAQVIDGVLIPGDDADAASWFTVEQAQRLTLTDSVERCLRWAGLTPQKEDATK